MEQLPLELHLKVFGHLDLGDLMALRLVCKKFEHIVKEVKIKELVLTKDEHFWKSDESSLFQMTKFCILYCSTTIFLILKSSLLHPDWRSTF